MTGNAPRMGLIITDNALVLAGNAAITFTVQGGTHRTALLVIPAPIAGVHRQMGSSTTIHVIPGRTALPATGHTP